MAVDDIICLVIIWASGVIFSGVWLSDKYGNPAVSIRGWVTMALWPVWILPAALVGFGRSLIGGTALRVARGLRDGLRDTLYLMAGRDLR